MDRVADPRLSRLLGGEALADLRRRLRQRIERGATGEFRLGDLTEAERNALSGLLGRRQRVAASMTLNVQELDAALCHAGLAASLREALERLDGPIVDRAAERTALQAQWEALRGGAWGEPLCRWLEDARSLALLKRLAHKPEAADDLLRHAQAVLAALPAQGIPRSRLAADKLGDAHGLDPGRPVASVVLSVLRQLAFMGENSETADDTSGGGDSVRGTWAAAGVLVNELARPVLVLNLPVRDAGEMRLTTGEPGYVSLRQLLRSPPHWGVAGCDVYVCENPNLVAIVADVLGHCSAPLVCTDGMPGAAQRTLLLQLAQAGARLHYHGDFDWPGLAIGNWVMRACGAQPWRYGAEDYRKAVKEIPAHGRPLGLENIEADWDAELATVMRAHSRAIDEEAIAAVLVQDLTNVNENIEMP